MNHFSHIDMMCLAREICEKTGVEPSRELVLSEALSQAHSKFLYDCAPLVTMIADVYAHVISTLSLKNNGQFHFEYNLNEGQRALITEINNHISGIKDRCEDTILNIMEHYRSR